MCAAKYAGMPTPTVPMMWGLSVTLAIYVVGSISGAHLNPAVTAGLVAADKFPVEEAPLYMLAQTVGAALAGAVNYAIFAGAIAAHEAAEGIVRSAAAPAGSVVHAGCAPETERSRACPGISASAGPAGEPGAPRLTCCTAGTPSTTELPRPRPICAQPWAESQPAGG